MNFTPEQLTKARATKSADELLAMAKEAGVSMTEEQAAKYYAEMHKEGELNDDELDAVAGGDKDIPGCGSIIDGVSSVDPQHDEWTNWHNIVSDHKCPVCGAEMAFAGYYHGTEENYELYSCDAGGVTFEKDPVPDHRSTWIWFRHFES